MWIATLNGTGGELDRVTGKTEDDLKEALRDKLHPVGSHGWSLAEGDTIAIIDASEPIPADGGGD